VVLGAGLGGPEFRGNVDDVPVDGDRAFHVSKHAGGRFILDGYQLRQGFAAFGDDQLLMGGGDFIDQFQAFGLEFSCVDVNGPTFVTISSGHGRPPVFRG
jgi:hypothetical protein